MRAPEGLDSPDAGRFLRLVALGNAASRHDAGHGDLDQDPREVLGFWHDEVDFAHSGCAAERSGEMIGAVAMTWAKESGAQTLEFDLMIAPGHWGEGVEEALLAAAEREARAQGRRTIQTWTLHRAGDRGEPLVPITGWGAIPAADPQCRLLLAAGFELGQVERTSAYDLRRAPGPVETMLAEARAAAGDDYRPVAWTGETPEDFLDSFAYAMSRMSTDAPAGGMTIDEEVWDAARVRRRDARLRAQGLTVSVAAVLHLPTGRIVAFNELVIGEDATAVTQQYATLVVREHRGRRLGALVKCANLLRWRELFPASPRVSTFNAEENRHMLAINEAIGFTPVSYAGAWTKVLD